MRILRWMLWTILLVAVVSMGALWVYIGYPNDLSVGLIGLVGVLTGSLISMETQLKDSRLDRDHQIRLASLEKQLQAHQEAYTLWRSLVGHVHHREKVGDTVMECQTWWDRNCLYLSPKARASFRKAYANASHHSYLLEARDDPETVKENWLDIIKAGDDIVAGVALPSLGEFETKT